MIMLLTRTVLALPFLAKKSKKKLAHRVILLNFIIVRFEIRELQGVHLIPRFYCVVMEYTEC